MFGGVVVILDVVVGEFGVVSVIVDLILDIGILSICFSFVLLFFIIVLRVFIGMMLLFVRYNGSKM